MSNVAGYFRGKPACSCLLKWLPAYEAELKRRGLIKYNLDVYQLIGGAPKSGGTHVSGGAFDIGQTSAEAIQLARQMGADATWFRRHNWDGKGGMAHTHGVLRGCPHNAPARYQIAAVDAGYNGLGYAGRGGKDDGPLRYRRTWKQGLSWLKTIQPKVATTRLLTWNVYLIKRHPRLSVAYRTSKITAYVKKWNVDALALQEAPSSADGKHLFPKLAKIGLDKRVGSHARYIIFRSAVTKVHGWKSVSFGDKRATIVAATIHGHKRILADCHPKSGSDPATVAHRGRWATKVMDATHEFAKTHDVPLEDVIYMGDFNGSEFAAVAKPRGWVRATSYARIKSALTRTYNAWGKKHTTPGGRFDYVLVHKSKKTRITKAKTFFTPKASDHNPVFVEIKE